MTKMEKDNKKRYVYLDKYLDYQASIAKRFDSVEWKMRILFVAVSISIGLVTGLLYKIFE